MTIKHQLKNISAEKQYVITDVQDKPNGILTFILSNLHGNITDTIEIDLSKHKLRLTKVTQSELNRLKNSQNEIDIKDRESHIYLVPKNTNDEGIYQEFMWVDNDFELMGSTAIDLEPYFLKENVYNGLDYNQNNNTKALSAYQGYRLDQKKEDNINKKSSWSNLTTDIGYPSEKLVKDTILESIDKASELLRNNNDNTIDTLENLIEDIELQLANFPKKTSDLINDSDFVSSEDVINQINLTDYAKLTDLPQNTSDLINDSNFATLTDVANVKTITDNLTLNKENISNKVTTLDNSNDHYPSTSAVTTELNKKVDKVTGKGLSSNDYTTEEKDKLFHIEDNANNYIHPSTKQCNAIIPDSSEKEDKSNKVTILDNSSDHYPSTSAVITELNKKVDKVTGKGLSSNDYTTEEKDKLFRIEDNANNYIHPSTKQCNVIIPDISEKEDKSNKVTILDNSSDHYPSSDAIYPFIQMIEDLVEISASITHRDIGSAGFNLVGTIDSNVKGLILKFPYGSSGIYKYVTMNSKQYSFDTGNIYSTTDTFEVQVIFPATNTVLFSKEYNDNGEVT